MTQWTRDHSFAALLKERGELEGEIRDSKLRNRLLAAIGDDISQPEFSSRPLLPGDRLVFCSDGLWDMLPDAEIQTLLESDTPVMERVTAMIAAANTAGGDDNITVLVADVTSETESIA
jgi:PPM family protein phosphatase